MSFTNLFATLTYEHYIMYILYKFHIDYPICYLLYASHDRMETNSSPVQAPDGLVRHCTLDPRIRGLETLRVPDIYTFIVVGGSGKVTQTQPRMA